MSDRVLSSPSRVEPTSPERATGDQKPNLVVAGLVASGAAFLVTAGLLIDNVAMMLTGGSILAAIGFLVALTAPEEFVLAFVIVRPLLDLAPTYERGPSLNAPAGALLLVALFSWGLQHRRELSMPSPAALASLLLAAAGMASVLGSLDLVQSANMALRLSTIAALFVFAQQVGRLTAGYLPKLLAALLTSVAVVTIITVGQILDIIPLANDEAEILLDPQADRPAGPYPAPTVLATHLFIGVGLLLLVVPRLWAAPRWRPLVPHLVVLGGLSAWALAENQSRSPAIAILLAVAVISSVRWRVIGASAALMLVLAAAAFVDTEGTRFDEVGSGAIPGAEADTVEWRLDYWQANLPRFGDSPITGIGLGRVEQINIDRNPPHSTVVQSIVEMGAFGAIAHAAFALLLLRELALGLRAAAGTRNADLMLVVLTMCIGYAFIGLFENLLTQVVTSGPMALLAGTALGLVTVQSSA